MKTTFFFLTWLILLAIIKRLIPDWFNDTKPEEEEKVIKPRNSAVTVTAEKDVVVIKPKKANSSPSIESKPQKYYYSDDQTSSQTKKEKPKRKIIPEDIPDDFYALSRLTISPVFSVVNLKNPANSILEFYVKGFNIYGKEIPTGEIIWETSGGKIDKNGRLVIDREAQGFYQVTATSNDSIKHTKFIRNTLLTVGVSTRILKWSIANESFFYDVLSQLFDFSFDFDGDGEISIDELMIGDWMIDFGRKYILDFLTKTSNFCINEYLKTISATTFYLVIPALSKESNQPISSTPISSELSPEPSKIIKPEKNITVLTSGTFKAIDLHKFLSENKGKEGTLIQFRFKNNTVEIGVDSPEFFITEKFELEDAQNPGRIESAIFVKCEDAEKVIPVLSKSKAEDICLEKRDNKLFILPNCSIPIERDVPNRQRAAQNVVVIKDPSILHWFAAISTTAGKNQSPPAPYIEGALFYNGFSFFAVNAMMFAQHSFLLAQLVEEWGSSITIPEGYGYERRFTIPATAIAKFDPSAPIEIHISGTTTTLKSGSISLKIEKLKDPLSVYMANNALNNKSSFSISLDEPEDSSEPSRMEKLVNWVKQSKSTSCDLLVGPSGVWVGPRGALKKPDFASDEAILAKSLHLDTMPCGNTNRIASFTVSVIKTIAKLGMKSVKISFPEKEDDILCIESLDSKKDYSIVSAKAIFVEVPIAEVVAMPVAELADSKPLVIEKGGETLMEVVPTVAETINTAIADAQKAIAETAIVEAIDPNNVVTLNSKTKKKAKLLQEAVQATKVELETELKSESIDLNRIIELTLRLDTVGGRFIEIVFSLKKNFISVLNIDEKFKEDAAKAYPHLAQ